MVREGQLQQANDQPQHNTPTKHRTYPPEPCKQELKGLVNGLRKMGNI